MELIDKSALVAEIERLKSIQLSIFSKGESIGHCYDSLTCISVYNEILSFLDTQEVKEVDLEKEIKDYFDSQPIITRSKGVDYQLIPSSEDIAKHFYSLGLKAQKGEEV